MANNPDDFPARMLKRDKRGVGAAVESFIQHDVDQKKLDLQQAFIQARALGRLDHQGDLYGNAIDWTNFIYWATDPAVKEPTAELSELRTVCETYLEQISKDPQLKSDIRAVAGIALKTEPRTPEEVYATRIAYAGLTDAERAKKAQQALAVTSSKAKTSGQPLLYPLPRPDEVNPPLKTKIPPIITKNAKALRSDSFSFDVGAGVEDDEGEISPLLFKVRGTRDEPFLRNLEATHKRHQDLLERVALQKAKDGAKAAEAKAVAARAEAEATKSPQAETAAVKAEAEAAKANTEALRTESAQTKASALAHPRTQNPSQTRPESLTNNKPQELPLPEQSTTSNTLSNDPASKKAVPRLTKAFNVGRNGILPDLSFSSEAGRLLARPLVKPGSGEPVIKALPLPSRSKPDPATPLAQSSTSSTHSVVPEPVIKPLPLPLPLHNSIRQSVSPLGRFSNLPIAQKASSTIHSSVKQTSGWESISKAFNSASQRSSLNPQNRCFLSTPTPTPEATVHFSTKVVSISHQAFKQPSTSTYILLISVLYSYILCRISDHVWWFFFPFLPVV